MDACTRENGLDRYISYMCTIYIDSNANEDKLAQHLLDTQTPVVRCRQDVGDVRIVYNDEALILERKTWSDLRASICDGRWKEQKERLMRSDDEATLCMPCYVIEGPLLRWEGNGRLPNKNLLMALAKTQVRDNIHVFHTVDSADTAKLVNYLASQLEQGGFSQTQNEQCAGGTCRKRKRDNYDDPQYLFAAMLTIVPGMSRQKANCVVARFPTPYCLSLAHREDLIQIVCKDRRLGPKLADRLRCLFAK